MVLLDALVLLYIAYSVGAVHYVVNVVNHYTN